MSQARRTLFELMLACVAIVSVRLRSKERGTRVKHRAKNGVSKRAGIFWLLFHFSRGQNRGLSLLRNQTETLATQAKLMLAKFFKSELFSCLPKVDHVIN